MNHSIYLNYLQTLFHSYLLVYELNTCFCVHDVVPSGFNFSEGKGLMLGEVKGQIFGGQIGGISKVELHNA